MFAKDRHDARKSAAIGRRVRGAGRGTSKADGRGCNTCALQAANGRGAGQVLRCVQAPRVVVGCRLQRSKMGRLQAGSERRQPPQPASQASCRVLQRAPHWHVTGTSSFAVAATVTRHMSHVTHRAPAVTRRVKDSVFLRCSMRVVARRSQARFRSSTSQSSSHAATFAPSRRRLLNSHFIPVLHEH